MESTATRVYKGTHAHTPHLHTHTHTPDESMTAGFQIKEMETLIHSEQIEQCIKFGPSFFVSDYF